jgi:hypothetical protein
MSKAEGPIMKSINLTISLGCLSLVLPSIAITKKTPITRIREGTVLYYEVTDENYKFLYQFQANNDLQALKTMYTRNPQKSDRWVLAKELVVSSSGEPIQEKINEFNYLEDKHPTESVRYTIRTPRQKTYREFLAPNDYEAAKKMLEMLGSEKAKDYILTKQSIISDVGESVEQLINELEQQVTDLVPDDHNKIKANVLRFLEKQLASYPTSTYLKNLLIYAK